jgi:EAL domain-containing protein (putative c-di-GMP-specific phosphodiesterase class I)
LADRAFHRHALAALTLAGPNLCERLVMEITETSAVDNLVAATMFIEQLHALGVRVSLDDFGAGTASFGYLRALKVDCLKIDGQFVQGLLDDPLSKVTVRCFIEVAELLGIPTVAEYVDHPDLIEELKVLGVTFAQGFLIAKPVPINDFLAGR